MSPDAYRRAAEIFERIHDLPQDQIAIAVEQACSTDRELRIEVLRLLDADRNADGFLARPAIEDAAQILQLNVRDLPVAGVTLGNYRLEHRIGAGGMGVVFEAEDVRLQRRIAVKILPEITGTESEERLQRFRREARASSALNHPNIVSIFDADFAEGFYFIAMELVQGSTLRDLINMHTGGVEKKTVLDVISQIASALTAAHEAGIVHRDIKPENIMIRPDGFVKVLDFGLAKLHEPPVSHEKSELRTRPGAVAGTVQYLSPEQVLGKPAGPLSDVFSLGVVAYELATGIRPFAGPTDGAIFEAIVNRIPPEPSSVRASLGSDLDALIMRAIEKDPELRFQTASDFRAATRLLLRGPQQDARSKTRKASPQPARRAFVAAGLGAAGGILVTGVIAVFLLPRSHLALPTRFDQMTFDHGEKLYPSLSSDGKQFIYASPARGKWDIYLQRVGGSKAIDLTAESAADETEPALSPDGNRIAFRSERGERGLFVMEATGENPRRIAPNGHLPNWSPDGKAIVYCDDTFVIPNDRGFRGSRLHLLDLTSNAERVLPTEDAVQPNWSPHGLRIAYWGIYNGNNREVFTIAADGGDEKPVPVTDATAIDWNPVWAPSGRELYFISDRGGTMNVWRVPIDERTGKTSGAAQPFTIAAAYVGAFSWAAAGDTFVYSQAQNRANLSSVQFDPSRVQTVGSPVPAGGDYNINEFSLSPDETQIVHDTVGDPQENLWIVNVDGSGRRKLTSDSFRNRLPAWSPNGDQILFISNRSGSYQEYLIRPDGSGLRPLTRAAVPVNTGVWIDNGHHIAASLFSAGLALLDPRTTEPITAPTPLPGFRTLNGKSYAFTSRPENGLLLGHIAGNGENPIVLYSLSDKKLTPVGVRGIRPSWVPGSMHRYFVFLRGEGCFLYDRDQKRETPLFSTAHNQLNFLQISAAGRRIFFTQTIRNAELWIGKAAY